MTLRHLLITFLVALTAGLVPLAQASPPDQTWLGGLYDDADYDDVVLGVTSAVSAVDSQPVRETASSQPTTERPIQLDEGAPILPALSPTFSRAPPAS